MMDVPRGEAAKVGERMRGKKHRAFAGSSFSGRDGYREKESKRPILNIEGVLVCLCFLVLTSSV